MAARIIELVTYRISLPNYLYLPSLLVRCIHHVFTLCRSQRRVEAAEMDALRRSFRISRKERIGNVSIRQQIGLEETIIKKIEQNQLTR
jgi:hypothetical protein